MDQKLVAELTANVKPLFKELSNAVKELKKSTDKMAASIQAFAEANKRAIQKAADDFDKLSMQGQIMAAKLARANAEAAAAIAKAKSAESKQVIAAENAKLAAQKAVVAAEQALEKQRRAESDATARTVKANADRLKRENADLIRQTQALLRQATREGAPNTYQNLAYQTSQLTKELKNLPGAFDLATGAINRNNKEAVALQEQVNKNNAALKNADALMNQHQRNVGNYRSALGGLRSELFSLAAGYFTVQKAIELIVAAVGIVSTMERQHMALKNASTSAQEYNKNLKQIEKIALTTGAPIIETSDALRKFTGATRGTAIEGEKARKIFTSFSSAFAANGASTEELSRATKALSDMMSKGTIQAEELKGQLGDAMPGAVKLFADAMGVSTLELMKMMANGELLAEDVLPKVAAMLEKTVGTKAQDNLKTISGSWQDVKNQVVIFLDTLNNDRAVSNFFVGLNGALSGSLKLLKEAIGQAGFFNGLLYAMNKPLSVAVKAGIGNAQQSKFDTFEAAPKAEQQNRLNQQKKAVQDQEALVQSLTTKLHTLGKETNSVFNPGFVKNKNLFDQTAKDLDAAKNRLDQLNRGLKVYNSLFEQTNKKQGFLNQGAKGDSPEKTIANIRSEIDKIPARAIGENGKADVTKDQAKNLRGMRDEVVNLFNTLSKADVERLKLKSLKDELTTLLSGEKKGGSGRGAGLGPQRLYDLDRFTKILAEIRGESDRLDTMSGDKLLLENLKDREKTENQINEIRKLNVSEAAKDKAIAEANELLQKRIADRIEDQNKKLTMRGKTQLSVFGQTPDSVTGKVDIAAKLNDALNRSLIKVRAYLSAIGEVSDEVKDFLGSLGPMWEVTTALYGQKIKDINVLTQTMLLSFAQIGPAVADSFGQAIDALLQFKDSGKSIFKQFGQAVLDTLRQVISKLIATVVVAELLNLVIGGMGLITGGKAANFGGGAGFKVLSRSLGLPMFAEGGVVNKATLGVFGEAGPEAVMPLDKLNGMLATAAAGGGGQGYIAETQISLDNLWIGLKRAERKMN